MSFSGMLLSCEQEDSAVLGARYFAEGKYSEAMIEYKKAVKLDPLDYQSYNILGMLNMGVNDEVAMKYVDSSLAINNSYVSAYVNKGAIENQNGYYTAAVEALSKAISIDSNFLEAYFNRGIAFENLKENSNAIKDFRKVIELDSTDFAAYYHLGLIYISNNEVDKACECISKSISIERIEESVFIQNKYCENLD